MKSFKLDKFLGVNKTDNPQDLPSFECTDLQNVRITLEKILKRAGTTAVGDIGNNSVRSLQSVRGILVATHGTICEKLVGSTWTAMNLTGINGTNKTHFIEFPVAVAKGSPVSATITGISNNGLTITASGASWTPNAYVGDIARLSGQTTGAKQFRKIVLNTATTLTLSESLNTNTDADNTVHIEDPTDATYFFNGEAPKTNVLASLATTWTAFVNTGWIFQYVAVYKSRIVGVKASSHKLYVSPLLIGEDFPYEFEVAPGTKDYITGIAVFGDQLIIHKGDSGVWIAEAEDSDNAGAVFNFTQRAESNGALSQESIAVGENIMFYTSTRGIEWFNPLEVNELEGHMALSDYKVPAVRGNGASTDIGFVFDAKYFCYINSTVYIFDIARYIDLRDRGVSNPYPFLIDSGYTPTSFAALSGTLYIGAASDVFSHTGTTDNTVAITSYWEKQGITFKEPSRMKVLKKLACLHSGGTTSDNIAITVTTDKETSALDTMTFAKDFEVVGGKRQKGRTFKVKFDITNIGTGSLESAELIAEVGKIVV